MSKKLLSLLLVVTILIGCFSVCMGSVVTQAREVGVGTGAESFNPVKFTLTDEVIIGTNVSTSLNVEIIESNYKVKINSISAYVPYYTEGGISYLNVAYEAGTVVTSATSFPVTGAIIESVNSVVRYTIGYDILDSKNNTVWKNLTGYTYGFISGKEATTGAVGTYHNYPGQLSDGCYFENLDTLNTIYVQQSELMLNYKIRTQSAWNYCDPRIRGVNVISGNAPSTLDTMPDNNGAEREGQMDWPKCGPVYRSSSARWLAVTEPPSGYYNFTISFNSWNDDWEDQSNITETTEMYYITSNDKAAALNAANKIIKTSATFSDGYYVQKGLYTEESWNTFILALDNAYQVAYSVPNANYGYKIACRQASGAAAALDSAFAGLQEAEHDFYSYKDSVVTEPTCTESGSEFLTCICGEEKTVEIPALGHDQGEWVVTKEATCTEQGADELVCTRCGDVIKTRATAMIAHTYESEVTLPTCTERGYTTYTCSVCSDSYMSNYVDALGHKYNSVVTEPTCTEKGYTTYICSVCENSLVVNSVKEKGHVSGEAVQENAVEATCTESGSYDSVVYCTVCGEEVSRETVTVDALGHTEGEWKVTKEPTYTEAGEETLYCSVCGEAYDSRVIAQSAYFKAAEGTETVVDKENGIIYGLPADGLYDLEGLVEYAGGTLEYVETSAGFGTGTTVNFVVNGEVYESYTIVIFGDITGDGVIDTYDSSKLAAIVNGDVEVEEGSAIALAADITDYGVIDTYDLSKLNAVVNGDTEISQIPVSEF